MKQTIEIEVPEGKEAVWKDGRVFFIDKQSELPKTWAEFCMNHPIKNGECYISNCSTIESSKRGSRLPYSDGNNLPSFDAAKAHFALMRLHQLRDCYRQGWKPNLSDGNYKYVIKNCCNKLYIRVYSSVGEFLSFQSQEIAEEFLTNFRDLIEQANDLI